MAAGMRGTRATTMMVVVVMAMGMASAATYNVGEPGGSWDLNTNYANWVSQKKFHPGDQIVFKYPVQQHDVVEVSKAGYDSCSTTTTSMIATHTTGNDVIPLNSTGTRYFICGFPGHCTTTGTGKMKVQIDVVAQATDASPAPPPPATTTPPSPPSSASPLNHYPAFIISALLLAAHLLMA